MPLGGIGWTEMLLIAMIALMVFGPRRLPEVSRSLGRAMREFRRGMNEIQRELEAAERAERPASKPARPAASPSRSGAESATAGTETRSDAARLPGPTSPVLDPVIADPAAGREPRAGAEPAPVRRVVERNAALSIEDEDEAAEPDPNQSDLFS